MGSSQPSWSLPNSPAPTQRFGAITHRRTESTAAFVELHAFKDVHTAKKENPHAESQWLTESCRRF